MLQHAGPGYDIGLESKTGQGDFIGVASRETNIDEDK